jgi:hypothetical protein
LPDTIRFQQKVDKIATLRWINNSFYPAAISSFESGLPGLLNN